MSSLRSRYICVCAVWLEGIGHISDNSTLNSLAPESGKSSITYNANQPYTYGTKIDVSACLPEAFSGRYCNLGV